MKSLYDLLEKILVLRQLELFSQENADIICRRGRLVKSRKNLHSHLIQKMGFSRIRLEYGEFLIPLLDLQE